MMTIREYKRVESLEEAWELNQKKANRVIGGMIWLKMSRGNVGTAIDISGLGLDQIEETEDAFEIGAMVTLRQLEEHPGLAAYTDGAMRESVRHIVGVQLRNLATVGGSIYGRFGFSDVLTMFLAMDTEVELYKAGRMPLVEFAKQIGGREEYFKEHGDYEVDDYNWAMEKGLIPEGYYEWWGYEDEKLFSFAKDRLTEIAAEGEPFNFTMLTADTHFEDGYPCELCDEENDGDNQYGMVLHCSSKQVTEFVSWIQQQDFYENTTIVISGDHLTMDSDFCENIDPDYIRTVYNVIINSPIQPQQEKNRSFTTMDMFPTTIASLGATIEGDRLGLGTNLFSGEQTLAEKLTFDQLNDDLSQKSKFFEKMEEQVTSIWTKTDEGWRFYIEDEDRWAKSEWVSLNPHRYANDTEQRYYIDANGYAVKGWKLIDGKWYYFSTQGSYRLLEGPCDEPFEVDESQYS